jgi:hypothetical protein
VPEALLEALQPSVTANPEQVRLRKSMGEQPCGTRKRGMDHGYFRTRGLAKVRAEMRLTVLADTRKRVITMLGVTQLLAAVR